MSGSGLKIEVYQQDWIPGFAAFADDGRLKESSRAHVVLNLGAFMAAVASGDLTKEEVPYSIAEVIMHKVFHVLECWAGVEFSEERVEALLEQYTQSARTP